MTVIFDLDHTLLDTAALKESLADAVTAFGCARERYDETYAATVRREGRHYDYDPDAHIALLANDFPNADARKNARAAIDGILRRTREFLFPGALGMLDALHDRGVRLVLLTMGNEAWQRKKIAFAGLDKAFDTVVTVAKDKADPVREYADGGAVVVVNDNGTEIDRMAASEPDFAYVWKRGPKPAPTTASVTACDSLDEVRDAVMRSLGING